MPAFDLVPAGCLSAAMALIDRLHRLLPPFLRPDIPIVPVVRLTGIIGVSTPLRPGLTLSQHARTLERACSRAQRARGGAGHQFARRLAGAVASDLPPHPRTGRGEEAAGHRLRRGRRRLRRLHARLRRRRDHLPIQFSIVGSIGVVGGSFGFDKLIDKLGIERRLYTSGEHKAMLDPFLPEKPEDVNAHQGGRSGKSTSISSRW